MQLFLNRFSVFNRGNSEFKENYIKLRSERNSCVSGKYIFVFRETQKMYFRQILVFENLTRTYDLLL